MDFELGWITSFFHKQETVYFMLFKANEKYTVSRF